MASRRILMGVIGRPHGVRGLVHVHSYTADPADLASFYPLYDDAGRPFALRWAGEGVAEIFTLDGGLRRKVADRTAAAKLTNVRLHVDRDQLPQPDEEEFYLADLVGLAVTSADGAPLGTVDAVHDYGGGASLEIGAHLVPFTRAAVPEVDLAAGRIVVSLPHEIEAREPERDLGRERDLGSERERVSELPR